MKAQIIAAREKAGRAVQAARALGLQIRAKQEKNEATAELETQFDAARTDSEAAIRELNRLEAMEELETQNARFTQPTNPAFSGRPAGTGEGERNTRANSRAQRREQQRMRAQLEMFARAGVTNMEQFARFREAHADAFVPFMLQGATAAMHVFNEHGFKPAESMALLTTTGELGGFLVPDEFRAEVLRDLAGFTVMRRICRVENTGSSALVFPSIASATSDADVRSSGFAGSWRAEGYLTGGTAPTVQNQPTFGQSRVPVHLWAPDAVEITNELVNDSGADVEGILAEVIAETKGVDEDVAFISGSGVSRPTGLMTTLSGLAASAVNSGHASQLTYDGLIDLFTNLPAQYRVNARFLMNSLTYGAVLKLKDGNGQPLFPINSLPNQLWAKGIEFSELMDDVTANLYPIAFGDFRYYLIADRQDMRIQRLVERYAPNVGILVTARSGGQTLRPAAFRTQKVAA